MAKKIAVKKTPAVKKAPAKAPAKSALQAVIDYPQPHEIVLPGHYSIRLTAHGATQAQIRVDGGEWTDCREAAGHFWHDWAPQPGSAHIEARARAGKGRWASAEREVVVKPHELSFVG